jgi:acyl-CoA synthetase (NDP forming)
MASPLGDRRVYLELNEGFLALGIPHYPSVEKAVQSLSAMCRYQNYLMRTS